MILDKQIRQALAAKLKASSLITSIVSESNILDFPIKKIDMNNTPSIGVFTLKGIDNSNPNSILNNNECTVYFEITTNSVEMADDIENLIDKTILDDTAYWYDYEGLESLEQPVYQSNLTQMDDEGARIRIVKSVTYTLKYRTLKGVETISEKLEGFDGKLIVEVDEDGNPIVDSQLNNEIEVNNE